jgi:tight adherence protein C
MELVIALVFASIVMLGLALGSFGRRPEQERLARLSGNAKPDAAAQGGLLTGNELSWFDRLVQPFAGDLTHKRQSTINPIRRRLVHAGYRRESNVITYFGSRVAFALGLPVLALAAPFSWGLEQIQLITLLIVAAGVGLVAPSYWLDQQVKARQKALELALPDALDLMVVCVEAGLGINASLRRVAEDFRLTHPVLSEEFELANFETRAGKSTTEALRGLVERTGVSEISSLSAMLIQTERFGTGVADTLRVHADGMRLRRLQRAEEQANKAPLKMLFPTVFIFVAMLIIIVGPAFLGFQRYFGGRG